MMSGESTSEKPPIVATQKEDSSCKHPVIKKKQTSATSKWSTLKKVVQSKHSINSMNAQEQAFLERLNTEKSSRVSNQSFADIVKAAIARDKLRKDIQERLSKLTTKEVQFLRDIVEDEDVTKDQLEKADHVLRTDPLYRLPHEELDVCEDTGVGTFKDSTHYDVSIEVDQYEIETIISAPGIDNKEHTPSSTRPSLQPSKYSYKSWELMKDLTLEYPIIGVSDEIKDTSRVLSPAMIDSLRNFLPFGTAEDNFWLKYSMSRDGASLDAMYHSIRQSPKTLLTIETFTGEVFGAFVSSPWRTQRGFYGSCEAFLWKLKESRFTTTESVEEQVKLEGNIEIFQWSQENRNIQMSNRKKIAIGGGYPDESNHDEDRDKWGLGIALDDTLNQGTSSPCVTFLSPNLAPGCSKDDVFQVANLEVWAFTPCQNEKEAEQLELGRMFVLSHFET